MPLNPGIRLVILPTDPNPPPKPFRFDEGDNEGVDGSALHRVGVEREVRFAIMVRRFLIAVERGMVV